MLSCTITYLVKFYTLIPLLIKTFTSCTLGRMKRCIVAICTSAPTHFSIAVRTGETGIQNYLLKPFSILAFEVTYKRIISSPVRESVFLKFS